MSPSKLHFYAGQKAKESKNKDLESLRALVFTSEVGLCG